MAAAPTVLVPSWRWWSSTANRDQASGNGGPNMAGAEAFGFQAGQILLRVPWGEACCWAGAKPGWGSCPRLWGGTVLVPRSLVSWFPGLYVFPFPGVVVWGPAVRPLHVGIVGDSGPRVGPHARSAEVFTPGVLAEDSPWPYAGPVFAFAACCRWPVAPWHWPLGAWWPWARVVPWRTPRHLAVRWRQYPSLTALPFNLVVLPATLKARLRQRDVNA